MYNKFSKLFSLFITVLAPIYIVLMLSSAKCEKDDNSTQKPSSSSEAKNGSNTDDDKVDDEVDDKKDDEVADKEDDDDEVADKEDDDDEVAVSCPPATPYTVPNRPRIYAGETPKLTELTDAQLPKNTVVIGTHAFQKNALTMLTLPPCVTHINAFAFANNQLSSITIPASVASITPFAFSGNRLTSLTFAKDISTTFVSGTVGSQFNNNPLITVTLSRTLYEAFKKRGIIPVADDSYFPNTVTTFQTHDGTKLNVKETETP